MLYIEHGENNHFIKITSHHLLYQKNNISKREHPKLPQASITLYLYNVNQPYHLLNYPPSAT